MRGKLIISLIGYAVLLYLVLLLPFNLYTPSRSLDMPGILWFVHLLLLYIHEAGHFFFSMFGWTLRTMGGSLMQILVPLVWYGVALREGSSLRYTALVCTGVSIVDVSIYIKDAGMLLLPLIGGLSTTHHDWANLMNEWGLIEWSYEFGEIVFWSGMILCGIGLYGGVSTAIKQFRVEPNASSMER